MLKVFLGFSLGSCKDDLRRQGLCYIQEKLMKSFNEIEL